MDRAFLLKRAWIISASSRFGSRIFNCITFQTAESDKQLEVLRLLLKIYELGAIVQLNKQMNPKFTSKRSFDFRYDLICTSDISFHVTSMR